MVLYRALLILFSILLTNCTLVAQKQQIHITEYDLQVKLDTLRKQLNVTALLNLEKDVGVNEFELLLNSNVKLKSVKSKTESEWKNISYHLKENNILHLLIPSSLFDQSKCTLLFEYDYPVEGPINNVLYIDRGYRWYPMVIDEISRVKITATVPREFEMFSAGDLVKIQPRNGFREFTWETKIPVFKIPLVLIRPELYRKVTRKCENKDLIFYFLADAPGAKKEIVKEACSVFQYFYTTLGPYPHTRLTLIEMPDFQGSFICTGLILVGSGMVDQFNKGYFKGLRLPIAAQWFGAGVFGKFNEDGFWFITLSLPHYLRLMYVRDSINPDAYVKQLERAYRSYKKIAGSEKDVPILKVNRIDTREKGLVIYGKGPFVLDILQREMGEDNWMRFIRELYLNNSGKILTYHQFKNHLKNFDRSGNLVLKFDKMMTEKGIVEN